MKYFYNVYTIWFSYIQGFQNLPATSLTSEPYCYEIITSTVILPAIFIKTRKLSWKNKECHSLSLWKRTSNFSDCVLAWERAYTTSECNLEKEAKTFFPKFKGIWQICNATYRLFLSWAIYAIDAFFSFPKNSWLFFIFYSVFLHTPVSSTNSLAITVWNIIWG